MFLGDAEVYITNWSVSNGAINISIIADVLKLVANKCSFKFTFTADLLAIATKIDKVQEGINPQLFGSDDQEIKDKDNENWYIIYNSDYDLTAPKPETAHGVISTYLCKDNGFYTMIKTSSNFIKLLSSDLEDGISYVIDNLDTSGRLRTVRCKNIDGQEIATTGTHEGQGSNVYWDDCILLTKDGHNIRIAKLSFEQHASTKRVRVDVKGRSSEVTLSSNSNFVIYKYDGPEIHTGVHDTLRYEINRSELYPFGDTPTQQYVISIDDVDKTKGTLFKIIKLPYCPIDYTIDENGRYIFDNDISISADNLELGGKLLKVSKNYEFGRTLKTNIENPLLKSHERRTIIATPNDIKDIKNETKLLNSEFYRPKFIYDSFSKDFDLEKLKDMNFKDTIDIEYKPSRVYNSNFLIKFPEYQTDDYDDEDYNNILICSRNNEVPIYSSGYLDYIRNGYNYDVKNKNTALGYSIAGGTISALTSGLTLGIPFAKGYQGTRYGQAFDLLHPDATPAQLLRKAKIRGGINEVGGSQFLTSTALSMGAGAASTILGTIAANTQAERNIDQKVESLRNTSISVSSNDDIDLLEAYSNNRAKLKTYKVSDKTKKDLFDLFYYTGYSCNDMMIPNTTSRYWFNYIQCEPVFKQRFNTYDNFMADMKLRYAQGVTIYHEHFGE